MISIQPTDPDYIRREDMKESNVFNKFLKLKTTKPHELQILVSYLIDAIAEIDMYSDITKVHGISNPIQYRESILSIIEETKEVINKHIEEKY